MDDIYLQKQIEINSTGDNVSIGFITDRDKFKAAKQILLGLAILYVLTIGVFLIKLKEAEKLLDICTTTFPPLATLILVFYFRSDKN